MQLYSPLPGIYYPQNTAKPPPSRTIWAVNTTAFITHCSKNSPLDALRHFWRWRRLQVAALFQRLVHGLMYALRSIVLLLCAAMALGVSAQSTSPEIKGLRVERADDGLYLWASLRFELPPAVEDALLKGIPMVFIAEADVYRDRWYWYDKQVRQASRSIRVAYQPLTRRWRLTVTQGSAAANGVALGQSFDSLAEAMAAAQRITRWKIAEATDIDPDGRHSIDFHFRLDLAQLPRPFQIGAASQSEWSISVSRNVRPSAPDAAR